MDRKGIIHTISYKRRDFVQEHSEFSVFMMANNSGNVETVLKKFIKSVPPRIMISPSIMTGIDLPGDYCRYQIILKVPYPSTQGALMKARCKRDPGYSSYIAAQQLVQAYGRTTRSEDDFSESFILDDNILWFLNRYPDYVPQYFKDAFTSLQTIPSPPGVEKMNGTSN
jgi:Rad3-related DNA helicase